MQKLFLTAILFLGLASIANAQNTETTKNEIQNFNVLAFSHDDKDEISTANVLAGKNEFLVAKVQTASKRIPRRPYMPRRPYVSINNEKYLILQSTEELAELEDKNNKDGQLNRDDKSFDTLYAASFVSNGNDKKLKITKLSDEASAIMIKKQSFNVLFSFPGIDDKVRGIPSPHIWGGKAVSIKSQVRCRNSRNSCMAF